MIIKFGHCVVLLRMEFGIKALETQHFGAPGTFNECIVLSTNAFHIVDIVWETELINIVKYISCSC